MTSTPISTILLPDGAPIRQRIAARMHATSDQVFDLLAVVGRDCVGALQFLKAGEKISTSLKPKGLAVSKKQIAQRLRGLKTIPLGLSEEEDFRLSIAGAQEKTAFLKIGRKWHVPQGTTPTTHIFKPQIGEIRPGLSFTDSVENEWLCAQITKAFGLPTAECEIEEFEDLKVLIVERFDRQWSGQNLIRIPQEDMCQTFGIPNFEKYQSEGGPGVISIMNMLNESAKREQDRELFMKTQIVFFLLAAIDGHTKNFSVRWGPKGFWMTPLYDILSAQPIVDRGELDERRIKMAMSIGNKPYWKVTDICRRHFNQTAKLVKFPVSRMESLIDEVLGHVPKVIDNVAAKLPRDFHEEVSNSIFEGMRSRMSALV